MINTVNDASNSVANENNKTNILIVVDMQNDFIEGGLGSTLAKELVPKVYKKIQKFNGTIIPLQDTHYENYSSTSEGRKLPIPHCLYKMKGWKIHKDIRHILKCKKDVQDPYLKETFGCTDLAEDLRDTYGKGEGIRIELVGLLLDICVATNALLLKSYMPEAEIVVDTNCCMATGVEGFKGALEVLSNCHIDVV